MKSLELVICISFRDLQTADGPGEIYSSISLFFGLPLSLLTLVNGQRNQYLNFCLFFFLLFPAGRADDTTSKQKKKKQTRSYSSLAGWVSITCVYCRCEMFFWQLAHVSTAKYTRTDIPVPPSTNTKFKVSTDFLQWNEVIAAKNSIIIIRERIIPSFVPSFIIFAVVYLFVTEW